MRRASHGVTSIEGYGLIEAITWLAILPTEQFAKGEERGIRRHLGKAKFLPFKGVSLEIFLSTGSEDNLEGANYGTIGRRRQSADHALQHCASFIGGAFPPML